jgi:pimeloyl-ACP methyl ester carboxylesterase
MKAIKFLAITIISLYIIICIGLFLIQESLLFHPTVLTKDYQFSFTQDFEEVILQTKDNTQLHSILFKTVNPKGVVYFLHGNGGCVADWGGGADFYLEAGYDILYLDYRGYGKSEGHITSEKQLVADAQLYYNYLSKRYGETNIILSGISMGTGMATQLAANNNKPRKLILQCPYSSLIDLVKENVFFIPNFIVKYHFDTNQYLEHVSCPVSIFHGMEDQVIPHQHSLRLQATHEKINLTLLPNIGHNDIPIDPTYQQELRALLE